MERNFLDSKTTIEIRDHATYTLTKIAEGLTNRRPLNAAVGKRGEVELRAHFLARNQEPNKKGWPKQDFWNRIREATALSAVDESGATITIADPAIAQKIYGGTIKPVEGKYLALPAIAEAYGRSARTFNNLEPMIRWINGSRRAVALVERAASLTRDWKEKGSNLIEKKGSLVGGRVFYWLVLSVTQAEDPRALPESNEMEKALREEAGFFIQELMQGENEA